MISKNKMITDEPAPSKSELIGEIVKNKTEVFRISISSFKGIQFIDVRVYYKDKKTGEYHPTKKGIAITKKNFRELVETLLSAYTILEKSSPSVSDEDIPDID